MEAQGASLDCAAAPPPQLDEADGTSVPQTERQTPPGPCRGDGDVEGVDWGEEGGRRSESEDYARSSEDRSVDSDSHVSSTNPDEDLPDTTATEDNRAIPDPFQLWVNAPEWSDSDVWPPYEQAAFREA
eukprot:4158391-Pyramimonas_sp.AAC.1